MRSIPLLRAALLLVPCAAALPRSLPAQAKVAEQVVAPNEQGLTYSISPKGAHLVAITQRGSRWVVLHDGVAGPVFDEILSGAGGGRISFSPDGERFGYSARLGREWVVMVDNKEVLRRPVGSNEPVMRGLGFLPQFTPNSRHWFLHYSNGAETRPGADPSRFVWDGVAGPAGSDGNIALSPDGERHAYVVTNPVNPQQRALVIDGKPAPYFGENPAFSADGTKLYTIRAYPQPQAPPGAEVLLDGRPLLRAQKAKIFIPPVGDQVVFQIARMTPGRGESWSLVVNGKRLPESESPYNYPVTFSADGKHFAVVTGGPGVPLSLVVDGVRQREYSGIDSVRFTDAGKVVYQARAGTKLWVVTGDQESELGYQLSMFPLALGKGGRVGYSAQADQGAVAVVDGKVTRAPGRLIFADLSFSPDGTRYAWWVGSVAGGPGATVQVDGAPGVAGSQADFAQSRPGVKDPARYIWSPDSKHTLHYGGPSAQAYTGEYGLFLGDRFISQGRTSRITLPVFTPDSKHLFWMAGAHERGMVEVRLDGKMVFEFDDQGTAPLAAAGAWDMGADGTLSFVIQTVEGFKRVRITPGPEDGVAAMRASGKPVGR